MLKSRREFLVQAAAGALASAALPSQLAAQQKPPEKPGEPPAGTPPAFGTAPAVGPEVSPESFVQAESLMQVEMTAAERAQAAGNWRNSMAALYERRTGPHKVAIEDRLAPYSLWDPVLPGEHAGPSRDQFVWSKPDPGALPKDEHAFAAAAIA